MKQDRGEANPGYGKKAAFRKITVTVPPRLYERLVRESARRKIAGEANYLFSALLREAVDQYLKRLDAGQSGDLRKTGT